MLKQGVHPRRVQERLGHTSIRIALDACSHVVRGIQKAAAESFDSLISPKHNHINESELVGKHYWQIISVDQLCLVDESAIMLILASKNHAPRGI